jgi:hypothetical protein
MNSNNFSSFYITLFNDGAKGGDESASEDAGRLITDLFRETNQVDIRIVEFCVFGKRAPVRKARLRLVVAHLVVSGGALITAPASSDKRNRDPVSNFEILYVVSGFYNFTGQLMPRNMGKNNVCIMPLPTVPIAQAHARRFDFDNHTMAFWGRGRHILKP